MNVRLGHGELHSALVEAISSKSFVHRLLIAAALSDMSVRIKTNIISKDMEATVGCLCALGASIVINKDEIVVNEGIKKVKSAILDCIESGSTARFILPVALLYADEFTLNGSGKLPERPFEVLCDELKNHGADLDADYIPINGSGNLQNGTYMLPGNVSSQYITGLLFALPLLDGDSKIVLTTNLESSGYIDITLSVLDMFGIKIDVIDNTFVIKGNQQYHGPKEVVAEGDWSNASYVKALGIMAKVMDDTIDIDVTNLNYSSVQGDRAFSDITDKYSELKCPVDIDCMQIPDLVPALSALFSHVEGESILRNVERLRIKESDRIEAIISMLDSFGIKSETVKNDAHEDLKIYGVTSINDIELKDTHEIAVDSFNDHRMVMAYAIMAVGIKHDVVIHNAEAVNKSYPGFFDMLSDELGMKVIIF